MLIPDKEFTFDHYRETTSFADIFDMYIRGEENCTPRRFLDFEFCHVKENNYIKYWNKTFNEIPNPNSKVIIKEYNSYLNNFKNKNFDGHYWVFTDRSFLRLLENLMKTNLFPFKLISFFPTAYNDNTFGVILELDPSMKNDSKFRRQQFNEMHEISDHIEKKRFEINAQSIIRENNKLKKTINKIMNIIEREGISDVILYDNLTSNTKNVTIGNCSNNNITYSFEDTGLIIQNQNDDGNLPSFSLKKEDVNYFIPNKYFAIEFDLIELKPSIITLYFNTNTQNINFIAISSSNIGSTLKYEFTDKLRVYNDGFLVSTRDYVSFDGNIGITFKEWGQKIFKIKIANLKIYLI